MRRGGWIVIGERGAHVESQTSIKESDTKTEENRSRYDGTGVFKSEGKAERL